MKSRSWELSLIWSVHKVRHAIFGQFQSPSPCHTSSHIPRPPNSTSHISDPRFLVGLVQKIRTKALCTNSISIVREGFCPYSLLLEYICYNRKLKITLNFMFHM